MLSVSEKIAVIPKLSLAPTFGIALNIFFVGKEFFRLSYFIPAATLTMLWFSFISPDNSLHNEGIS